MLNTSSRKKVSSPTWRYQSRHFFNGFYSSSRSTLGFRFENEETRFSRWSKAIARARHENHVDRNQFCSCRPRDNHLPISIRVYWLAVSYVRCMLFFLKESIYMSLLLFPHSTFDSFHYLLFISLPPLPPLCFISISYLDSTGAFDCVYGFFFYFGPRVILCVYLYMRLTTFRNIGMSIYRSLEKMSQD